MITLTPKRGERVKSFFYDLCICYGLIPNTRSEDYCDRGIIGGGSTAKMITNTIMKAITRRTFNWKDVDDMIEKLVSMSYYYSDSAADEERFWRLDTAASAAKYLAWICAKNKIFWNDVGYTPEEREDMRRDSLFAKALADAECFVSQPSTVVDDDFSDITSPVGTKRKSASSGTGRKSDYKSAGPQSKYVAGLISKPGEPAVVMGDGVYCIVAAKAGTIIPNAFIHPVNNPDYKEYAKVDAEGKPTVKFGAGNGYTDLTIYSESYSVMERILEKIKASGLTARFEGVHVAKVKNSPNKYYKVDCEFGEVLVRLKKLNEKLLAETLAVDAPAGEADDDLITEAAVIEDIDTFAKYAAMYD